MGDANTPPPGLVVPGNHPHGTPGAPTPGTASPGGSVAAITEALAAIQQPAEAPPVSSPIMNERTRLFSNRRGTASSFGSPSPNEKSSLRPQELVERKPDRVVDKVGNLARRSLFGKFGTKPSESNESQTETPDLGSFGGARGGGKSALEAGGGAKSAGLGAYSEYLRDEDAGGVPAFNEAPLRGERAKGRPAGEVRWENEEIESAPPSYSEEGSEASFGSDSSDEGIFRWWWNSRPRTVLWHLPVQLCVSVFLAAVMGTAGSVLGALVLGEDDLVHYHPTVGRMSFGFLFSVTGSFIGAYFPPRFCHSQTTASWRMMLATSYPSGMLALAMAHEGQSWWSGALLLPCIVNVAVYWITLRDKHAPDPDDPGDTDSDAGSRPWKVVWRQRDAHLQRVADRKRAALGMR